MIKNIFRRITILFCIIMMFVMTVGCGKSESDNEQFDEPVFTTEIGGREVVVDTVNSTIADGDYVYKYDYSYTYEEKITIYYPNGYRYDKEGNQLSEGVNIAKLLADTQNVSDVSKILENAPKISEEYEEKYISGYEICEFLQTVNSIDNEDNSFNSIWIIVGIICALFGVLYLKNPEKLWYLQHGWRYKNAEPSDTALSMYMYSGAILIIAGIVCFVIGVVTCV